MKNDFNYRIIQLANNKGTALVDAEDYEEINKYSWMNSNGYASRNTTPEQKKNGYPASIKMHREVLGLTHLDKGVQVDHIEGICLDNRKLKLKAVTRIENSRNRPHQYNSKSGIKGVYPSANSKRWRAQIVHNDIAIPLGTFDTKEQAHEARLKKEKELGWIPATFTKIR